MQETETYFIDNKVLDNLIGLAGAVDPRATLGVLAYFEAQGYVYPLKGILEKREREGISVMPGVKSVSSVCTRLG